MVKLVRMPTLWPAGIWGMPGEAGPSHSVGQLSLCVAEAPHSWDWSRKCSGLSLGSHESRELRCRFINRDDYEGNKMRQQRLWTGPLAYALKASYPANSLGRILRILKTSAEGPARDNGYIYCCRENGRMKLLLPPISPRNTCPSKWPFLHQTTGRSRHAWSWNYIWVRIETLTIPGRDHNPAG